MEKKALLPIFTMPPPFPNIPLYVQVNRFLEKIEKEFPININTYIYKKNAFDHDVFIINNSIVFRFPRTQKYKKHLNYEIQFLNFLKKKLRIDLPEYLYRSKGCNFAGYNIIKGKTLTPARFEKLSKKNKEIVINQLIQFINQFHKIKITDFKKFKPLPREDYIEIEKDIEIQLKEVLFSKISKTEVDSIKTFYDESKEYLKGIPQLCPIHGDLYAYNIIWNEKKRKIGIIDFSDFLIGDPAKDFEVFFDYGKDAVEIAYENYNGTKDKDFLKRAEIYYKLHSIYTLLSVFFGAKLSFDSAYEEFKLRFNI